MKKTTPSKRDLLIVLIVVLGFVFLGSLPAEQKPEKIMIESTPETVSELPKGEFIINEGGNFYGDFYVNAFAESIEIDEPFCEEDCKKYNAVVLVPTEIGNEDFKNFLQKGKPENVPDDALPRFLVGCFEEDRIFYSNHSDEFGMKEFELDAESSKKIIDSSIEAPVTIKLSKKMLSGGMGAPACYSHFTELEVIN